MKIRAERKALAETVAWVSQAVPKKAQVPATAGIHITATKKNIVLRGFDYEIAHVAVLPADVGKVGEALVPAVFLKGVLSSFKTAAIELELDGKSLTVKAGSARYTCRVLPLEDYPRLPEVPAVVGHINADALNEAIGLTAWASDPNPASTNLIAISAVHIQGVGDSLTMTATDRFVMAQIETTYTGAADFVANVPATGLITAAKGMTDTVAVCHEGGLFGLSDGNRTVTLRCLDIEYPLQALTKAMRETDPVSVTVDGEDLLEAVKRAGVLAEREGIIVLDATDSGLTLSVPATEEGDGNEVLDAEVVGGEAHGNVAPGNMSAALAAVGAGPVTLGFDVGADGKVARKLVHLRTKHEGLTVGVMPKQILGAR